MVLRMYMYNIRQTNATQHSTVYIVRQYARTYKTLIYLFIYLL